VAFEVLQGDVFAFFGGETKGGGFVADFEHEIFLVRFDCAVNPIVLT
jgi:hypothetical protein